MNQQVRKIFTKAAVLPPEDREAYLAKACGEDAELRLEVQRLLIDAERADSFFGDETDDATLASDGSGQTSGKKATAPLPDTAAPAAEPLTEKEGDVIGPFKLLQEIGEGGFGTVWMAEQSDPISRRVALKVIKAGMDTKEVLARFEAERQALAMMDHPHIAKVLDAGATPTGRPWFAMELVKGIPITQFCDEQGLGTKERLALFGDVCAAINHAHQKGVIHRDIKPNNVMVTLYADKPVVKVIDFGIAKATQGKLTDQTLFTRFEQFIGTPVYMSPEQAALSAVDIDTRSDIYALGVLLYELLTGKPPFDSKSLVSAGYDEMRRIIREEEPPRPSLRLATVGGEERTTIAKARHVSPDKLGRLVETDLDWIVMKAIEKDRTRRYETANAFAADIGRYLGNEPVQAVAPSASYKFRKFVGRNKAAFGVAAAMVVLLLGGIAATSWQAVRATRARVQSDREKEKAWFNEGLGWLLRAEVAEERNKRYPDTLLYAAKAIGYAGQGLDENGDPDVIPYIRKDRNPQAFARAEQWIASRPGYRPVWSGDVGGAVTGLSVSPHGRYLLVGGKEGSKRWDFSANGTDLPVPVSVAVAIHPGGERFAIAEDAAVVIREGEREIARYGETVTALAYNLSGDLLAGAGPDGSVILLGETVIDLGKAGGGVTKLVFGPKDATLAAAVPGVGARLFFHHDRAAHLSWSKHEGDVTAISYHPDPKAGMLALGTADGFISIWKIGDATKIAQIAQPEKHDGAVTGLSFASDGDRLVSSSEDGLVRLWDTGGDVPVLLASLTGHIGAVRDVAFLPGGTLVASGGDDGTAKLWEVRGETEASGLYFFVQEGWYGFEEGTQKARWSFGTGFLNLSPETLAGAWQTGEEKSWADRWIESGKWTSAGLVSADRSVLSEKMGQAVEEAVKSGEWNLARLRSREMALLGLKTTPMGNPVEEGGNFTNGEGAEMIWCKPGTFLMGEVDGLSRAKQHQVTLSRGFWMGKHEVTQELYERVMGTNPSTNVSFGPKAPAENLNWHEAVEFCRKLTDLERSRGSIPEGWEYALPTEAQWEYACRAGTTTTWSFGGGESEFHKYGNFNDRSGRWGKYDDSQDDGHQFAAPVGSYLPNPWGFHDMHGNVWEWCRDSIDYDNPNYPEGAVTDPYASKGGVRVNRGGGYGSTAAGCRSANRNANQPTHRFSNLGLRPALVPSSAGR